MSFDECSGQARPHNEGGSNPEYVFGRPMKTYLAPRDIARLMIYRSRVLAEFCEHVEAERIGEEVLRCSACQTQRAEQ